MREICGLLCDLDGTLIESEDLHFEAWFVLMGRYGHVVDEGWNSAFIGLPDSDAVLGIKREFPDMVDVSDLLEEKQTIFRDLVRKKGSGLVYPGVAERLVKFRDAGLKLAVATNSIRQNTELSLECGGIRQFFQSISSLDMLPRGKPFPDIYQYAADGIGFPPEKCAVIEDSVAGLESARAAECGTVLAVATTWPADKLTLADEVFANTAEAMDWVLERLAG